jgi:hypothetical protein
MRALVVDTGIIGAIYGWCLLKAGITSCNLCGGRPDLVDA